MILVHVTHEAVEKVGGIGAVIEGLVGTDSYRREVSRTILLGPLMKTDVPVNQRLGQGGRVIYSSLDEICGPPWMEKFAPIERTYEVNIVYGTRQLVDPIQGDSGQVEVLLLDVFHANKNRLDLFKAELYSKFAIRSDPFEDIWEYEQYVRLAEPGLEALQAIGCGRDGEPVVILAHEYMGMPTALKAILRPAGKMRTIFYAHEVASARAVVENSPGHDVMFFNVMDKARLEGRTLEELFPEVLGNYKHQLVKAARYCDAVFAVGDSVVSEMKFLDPHFRTMAVELVYNGVPAERVSLEQRDRSAALLRRYAENLFGWSPTWVFTHVARPVLSKGIWRDLAVLDALEPLLKQRGETAVYYMLGTLAGQRRPQDVRQMERVYGWPVHHEYGYPDLSGGEESLGGMFAEFNRGHDAIRVVLVNQWGWDGQVCGTRMPPEMRFADIRCGTDAEFGLSVYEPFGISQLEPLSFAALCLVSNVCGCMGFVKKVGDRLPYDDNVIEADFVGSAGDMSLEQLRQITIQQREQLEAREAARLAGVLDAKLPRTTQAVQRRLADGYALASQMSWDSVVRESFLPGLDRAICR